MARGTTLGHGADVQNDAQSVSDVLDIMNYLAMECHLLSRLQLINKPLNFLHNSDTTSHLTTFSARCEYRGTAMPIDSATILRDLNTSLLNYIGQVNNNFVFVFDALSA